MADEQQKLKQARTLTQTSKDVGNPYNMAKILGVAGEGLWDFAQGVYDFTVPQTVEDWALEGSPLGKAVGTGAKMLAGLPFASYMPKLTKLKGGVGHGTTAIDKIVTEGIDPKKFDETDVLGWFMHAAEDPDYFNRYAEGLKGIRGERAGVLPLAPQAQNVLDLVDPDTNDLAVAVGQLNPTERMYALDRFKQAKTRQRDLLSQADTPLDRHQFLSRARATRVANGIKPSHYPVPDPFKSGQQTFKITDDPLIQNLPAVALADRLRLDKSQFASTPFDAVRYHDMDKVSWAFDTDRVPMTTTLGTEIPVQRPKWEQGQPRPSALMPSFVAGPEASQVEPWVGGLIHADDDAARRASELRNLQAQKQQRRVQQSLVELGFEPWASNIVARTHPSMLPYEINRMTNNRERQDALKAFQYLYPDQAEKLIRKFVNSPDGGQTIQALVPYQPKMSKVILNK